MKLRLHKSSCLSEAEIDIHYTAVTESLKRIILYIKQQEHFITGTAESHSYNLSINDVLYFETVDRKTFIYTQEKVYESKKTLTALEQELVGTTIVRIGKNMLMNVSVLLCVKPHPNHRLLAVLKNDERLIISRKYILSLQEKLRGLYYV